MKGCHVVDDGCRDNLPGAFESENLNQDDPLSKNMRVNSTIKGLNVWDGGGVDGETTFYHVKNLNADTTVPYFIIN